jgi:hypothetical protein
VTPLVITIVLGTGLLALLPTRRLSQRAPEGWLLTLYYLVLWGLLLLSIAVPPMRRLAVPVLVMVAIAPWLSLPGGLDAIRQRWLRGRRPAPRNVTPPSEHRSGGR